MDRIATAEARRASFGNESTSYTNRPGYWLCLFHPQTEFDSRRGGRHGKRYFPSIDGLCDCGRQGRFCWWLK